MAERAFSRTDLKKATIVASGGYCTGLGISWYDMKLWEIVEAIEMVSEIQDEQNSRKD
jgi:hypothetical protein